MGGKRFTVRAKVSTESPTLVRPVLVRLFPGGSVTLSVDPKELVVQGEMEGSSARELNRLVLSELRRTEKRTRLRSTWTCEGVSERFFDYVPKGTSPAPPKVPPTS